MSFIPDGVANCLPTDSELSQWGCPVTVLVNESDFKEFGVYFNEVSDNSQYNIKFSPSRFVKPGCVVKVLRGSKCKL